MIPSDDGDLDPRTPRAKPTLRGAAIVSARVIAGFVAIAVAAAVIAAAALVPLPSIRHGAPSAMITPVPTQQQLTCPADSCVSPTPRAPVPRASRRWEHPPSRAVRPPAA